MINVLIINTTKVQEIDIVNFKFFYILFSFKFFIDKIIITVVMIFVK